MICPLHLLCIPRCICIAFASLKFSLIDITVRQERLPYSCNNKNGDRFNFFISTWSQLYLKKYSSFDVFVFRNILCNYVVISNFRLQFNIFLSALTLGIFSCLIEFVPAEFLIHCLFFNKTMLCRVSSRQWTQFT